MTEIEHFINNLIDQDKVFPDGFFIQDSQEISEHLHTSVKSVKNEARARVVFRGYHKEHRGLLGVEVVDPIHIKAGRGFRALHLELPEKVFSASELLSEVFLDDRVSPTGKDKELRQH